MKRETARKGKIMHHVIRRLALLALLAVSLLAPTAQAVTPKVASGTNHSLMLKADGSVWAWGDNSVGQIGDPHCLP